MMFRYIPVFCCFLALLLTLQDSAGDSAVKYNIKVETEDGKDHEEEVEIDLDKETETFHVPKSSPDEEKADIILDFKKNLMMVRLPEDSKCFLSESTENAPKPADLEQYLKNRVGVKVDKNRPNAEFEVKGTLDDRSMLSEEMAQLCENLPIYRMVKAPGKRNVKRSPCRQSCHTVLHRVCFLFFCFNENRLVCQNIC